jgi:hypothetical protein
MDEPKTDCVQTPFYTTDYFFDAHGRKVKLERDSDGRYFRIGAAHNIGLDFPSYNEHCQTGNFKMWHVEYPTDPDIEVGPTYLELPMLDVRATKEEFDKYNELMKAAWTHVPWHESHKKQTYSLAELSQEISKTIKTWTAHVPTANERFRQRMLVGIKNVSKLLELCDYDGAAKHLTALKWDVQSATIT